MKLSYKILFLCIALVMLWGVGCMLYWTSHEAISIHDSKSWPSVQGTVLATSLKNEGPKSGFSPIVRYEYVVAGISYRGDRLAFGSINHGREEVSNLLARYPVGKHVPVFYDPAKPWRSVLEPDSPGMRDIYFVILWLLLLVSALSNPARQAFQRWRAARSARAGGQVVPFSGPEQRQQEARAEPNEP